MLCFAPRREGNPEGDSGASLYPWTPMQVRFTTKLTLAQRLMCSMFISARGREEKKAGLTEGDIDCDAGLINSFINPVGSSEVKWPFKVVSHCAEMTEPLYTSQSLDVGHRGKGSLTCSTGTPSRGWHLKASFWPPPAGLPWRDIWVVHFHVNHTYLVPLHCFEQLLYFVPKESMHHHFARLLPTESLQSSLVKERGAFHSVGDYPAVHPCYRLNQPWQAQSSSTFCPCHLSREKSHFPSFNHILDFFSTCSQQQPQILYLGAIAT